MKIFNYLIILVFSLINQRYGFNSFNKNSLQIPIVEKTMNCYLYKTDTVSIPEEKKLIIEKIGLFIENILYHEIFSNLQLSESYQKIYESVIKSYRLIHKDFSTLLLVEDFFQKAKKDNEYLINILNQEYNNFINNFYNNTREEIKEDGGPYKKDLKLMDKFYNHLKIDINMMLLFLLIKHLAAINKDTINLNFKNLKIIINNIFQENTIEIQIIFVEESIIIQEFISKISIANGDSQYLLNTYFHYKIINKKFIEYFNSFNIIPLLFIEKHNLLRLKSNCHLFFINFILKLLENYE